jgi:pyruvate/2-oxoglutarate dehydrogenase complex dihydrolipoamide acyltransferase (E2) component
MPRIDAAMQSGKVVEWLKKADEKVVKGEPIVLVEGEKTTFEIEAPASGVVRKLLCEIGADVPVGQIVAFIGEPDEGIPEGSASSATLSMLSGAGQTPASALQEETDLSQEIRASPATSKLAREHGIDLKEVRGTGPRELQPKLRKSVSKRKAQNEHEFAEQDA